MRSLLMLFSVVSLSAAAEPDAGVATPPIVAPTTATPAGKGVKKPKPMPKTANEPLGPTTSPTPPAAEKNTH